MSEGLRPSLENPPPSSSETRLEREGNVVHLYKPEATLTIIYGSHIKPEDPRQLPKDFSGLVLEGDGWKFWFSATD